MTTLRERLRTASLRDDDVAAHLQAGRLFLGATRVTDLDIEIPDGSYDYRIGHGPEDDVDADEVAAELAAIRAASAAKNTPRLP